MYEMTYICLRMSSISKPHITFSALKDSDYPPLSTIVLTL